MNPSKGGLYIDDGKTIVRVEDTPADAPAEAPAITAAPTETPTEELD